MRDINEASGYLELNKQHLKTMKSKIFIASAVFLIATTHHSYSADVTWDTVNTVSAATDVSTIGTLVYAKGFGPATTVNGVTFDNTPNYSDTFDSTHPSPQFIGFMNGATFVGTDNAEGQAYATLLDSGRYIQTRSKTANMTLSNLTVGQNYLVQFWVADFREFDLDRSETITGGANTSGELKYLNHNGVIHASYVIGTFTADATSQLFSLIANEDVQINAVQLRSLPNPAASTLTITSFSRQTSGDYIINFVGAPLTLYKVTKSPDLITSFEPLTNPVVEATTDRNGRGTATVLASEASEAKEFYRIEQ